MLSPKKMTLSVRRPLLLAAVRVRPKSTFRHIYSTWTPMPARHGPGALVLPSTCVVADVDILEAYSRDLVPDLRRPPYTRCPITQVVRMAEETG